ncbi:hypothetical protein GCM10009740_20860 [Terrabacter terrae]|uniref:Uncharacterized protein n=1 Tax=Terrabacter terrae TaxID=318434 RepID=A0ABN2U816_9MICO
MAGSLARLRSSWTGGQPSCHRGRDAHACSAPTGRPGVDEGGRLLPPSVHFNDWTDPDQITAELVADLERIGSTR